MNCYEFVCYLELIYNKRDSGGTPSVLRKTKMQEDAMMPTATR